MNSNILIYTGALCSILGMTLFQEQLFLKFSLLIAGLLLILTGLLMREKDKPGL